MDQAGEWYLDIPSDTLYLKRAPNQDLNAALIVAPKLEKLLSIVDARDIGSGIFGYYSLDLTIANNEIEYVPNIGINVGWGDDQTPIVNYRGGKIVFNKIHHACQLGSDCAGIHTKSNSQGGLVANNWIYDVTRKSGWYTGEDSAPVAGIYMDDGSDFYTVRGNFVERIGTYVWGPKVPLPADGTPGLNIKHRYGNIGSNITYTNNQAQMVKPGQEIQLLGVPINQTTITKVKAEAGITAPYAGIKEYLAGKRP